MKNGLIYLTVLAYENRKHQVQGKNTQPRS